MYLSFSLSFSLYLSFLSFLVMSCLLITLIKCLKGHKSLGSLFEGVLSMHLSVSLSLYLSLSLSFFGQVTSPRHSDQVSRIAL